MTHSNHQSSNLHILKLVVETYYIYHYVIHVMNMVISIVINAYSIFVFKMFYIIGRRVSGITMLNLST